jgi:serine/threonine protein kinase
VPAVNMYCPSCSIMLPVTAKRCTACGNPATLAPGVVVTGPVDSYTLDGVLGIGGMGIVYKALSGGGQPVVIKELLVSPDPAEHVENLRRFRREADVLMSLSRPAPFPECYGGTFQDLMAREFMAMEFIPGQDLEHVLAGLPNGKMDPDEALLIGIQVCDGLAVMHNHTDASGRPNPLVHRDIKPANIIQKPTGDICILDVGIARAEKQSGATSARATRAGTYEYVAPEQVVGTPNPRSDLYSLAATLFHLVTGNSFQGDWDARLTEVDVLPTAWVPIFRKAIAKDHNLRQRSIGDFKQDLNTLLPAHLRPLPASVPAQPAPTQAPFVPAPVPLLGGPAAAPITSAVTIIWSSNNSFLLPSGAEYRKVLAGRVISNGTGVPGANVTVPLISDTGGRGTTVQSQLHGDFSLNLGDTTVNSSVPRRDLTVVVEDQSTGAELYREIVTISRPAQVKRAGVGIGNALAAPFRAFANWNQQRRVNKAAIIQAKAQAKAAKIAAQIPILQAKQQAKVARAQLRAAAQAANLKARTRRQPGRSPALALISIVWAGIAVIVLAFAIIGDLRTLGWLAFIGGPFGFSVLRYFVYQPRHFFPKFGIALFGLGLIFWLLFFLATPGQPKPSTLLPVVKAPAVKSANTRVTKPSVMRK